MTTHHSPLTTHWSRRGYTLVELVVSSASATVLMAGLATALFLAGRALEGRSVAAERAQAAAVQSALRADLEHATKFIERSNDSATFAVPDRNGDGAEETLRYAWSDTSGELMLSVNGGPPAPVLTGVRDFRLAWFSRVMQPSYPEPPPLEPDRWGKRW